MHRFPGGAETKGFWHKQLPDHAPDWLPRWDNPEAGPARPRPTWSWTSQPRWSGRPTSAPWSGTPGPRGPTSPDRPTYALIDIDPGEATAWDDMLVLARLHRTALDHLGVRAQPKLTGRRGIQIWIPVAPGPSFEDTRAWVEQLSRAIGAVVPRPGQLEVGGARAGRSGPARLHAEREQQDPGRALQPAAARRGAGVRPDRLGRAGRSGAAARRLHDPDHPGPVGPAGDLFRTVLGPGQVLPPIS